MCEFRAIPRFEREERGKHECKPVPEDSGPGLMLPVLHMDLCSLEYLLTI